MPTYIALLRAVNVAGHGILPMADLRACFVKAGFANAQTLLQTGNVVFSGAKKATASLERLLEAETAKRLGLQTHFMVRTASEWKALVAANPFPDLAATDPARLVVMFLKDAADPKKVKALQGAITGREILRAQGKQAYITFPDGQGRSRLTNAKLERALGTSSTGRNWNTVLKLRAALLLAATALACASRAPEPAPEPRARPAASPTAARRSPSSLEAMLAEDMLAEQAMPWTATRRLVWSDFKGRPPQGGPEGARTAYGLYYAWFCRGETFGFRVTAALHPHRSWVKSIVVSSARENPRVLQHEQTHFDLTEVFARRMRQRFDTLTGACAKPDGALKAMAQRLVDEEKATQQRYDRETKNGLIADRQAAWSADAARMLAASRRYAQ